MKAKKPKPAMTRKQIDAAVKRAIKTGNWMIRRDNDGESYSGFRWAPIGEWTEAPDWNARAECGGGLHGVNHMASGYHHEGATLSFCETAGEQVIIEGNKIKVERARRLLVNELPRGIRLASLYASGCTGLTELKVPDGCTYLYASGCTGLTELKVPEGCTCLHASGCTGLTELKVPEGCTSLDASGCTGLTELKVPDGCTSLYASGCTGLTELKVPDGCTYLDASGCTAKIVRVKRR